LTLLFTPSSMISSKLFDRNFARKPHPPDIDVATDVRLERICVFLI
jgi:hypothetical protein